MPEIFEIKARLEGLKSIHNITYAMQIVTISRLKRITAQLHKLKDSLTDAKKVLGKLMSENEALEKSFFSPVIKEDSTPVFILFFSNRGFCGSFNQEVLAYFEKWCAEQKINCDSAELVCIGKKAELTVKRKNVRFFAPQKDLFSSSEQTIFFNMVQEYIKQGRMIYTVHFEFKSIVSQRMAIEQLYPPARDKFEPYMQVGAPVYVEPDFKTAAKKMKEFYYRLKILKLLQDSTSSEFSQRFLLMKGAVDNVKSLTEELRVNLNKERQRMITQEISEIISTFKALKKEK